MFRVLKAVTVELKLISIVGHVQAGGSCTLDSLFARCQLTLSISLDMVSQSYHNYEKDLNSGVRLPFELDEPELVSSQVPNPLYHV